MPTERRISCAEIHRHTALGRTGVTRSVKCARPSPSPTSPSPSASPSPPPSPPPSLPPLPPIAVSPISIWMSISSRRQRLVRRGAAPGSSVSVARPVEVEVESRC